MTLQTFYLCSRNREKGESVNMPNKFNNAAATGRCNTNLPNKFEMGSEPRKFGHKKRDCLTTTPISHTNHQLNVS